MFITAGGNMKKRASSQSGFSLIEILFTVFIVAVGLFGLSAMQVTSLKNVQESQTKTLAAFYLEDMAERMRANPAGIKDGDYDNLTVQTTTSSNFAKQDSYEWNQLITGAATNGGLPAGATGVVRKFAPGLYDIVITWKESVRVENQDAANPQDEIDRTYALRLPF